MQESLTNREQNGEPITLRCFAGLCDTVVPVKLGDQLLGFLRTGQVFTRKPTKEDFDRATRKLIEWGVEGDLKEVEEAYFNGKVLEADQYESMIRSYITDYIGEEKYHVGEKEKGIIPMTDFPFEHEAAPGHYRIGTAGGPRRHLQSSG